MQYVDIITTAADVTLIRKSIKNLKQRQKQKIDTERQNAKRRRREYYANINGSVELEKHKEKMRDHHLNIVNHILTCDAIWRH